MCQAFGQRSIRAITKLTFQKNILAYEVRTRNVQTFIKFFVYRRAWLVVMQFTFNKFLSNSFYNHEDIWYTIYP